MLIIIGIEYLSNLPECAINVIVALNVATCWSSLRLFLLNNVLRVKDAKLAIELYENGPGFVVQWT